MTTLKFGAFDFYVGGRGEARMFSLFQLNQLSALVLSSWLPVIKLDVIHFVHWRPKSGPEFIPDLLDHTTLSQMRHV